MPVTKKFEVVTKGNAQMTPEKKEECLRECKELIAKMDGISITLQQMSPADLKEQRKLLHELRDSCWVLSVVLIDVPHPWEVSE